MPQSQTWEFLIQQDGDHAWLPIEPPNVEILEGRYRIVAKSRYKNAPVAVSIQHEATQEDPPKRRTQNRKQQTNPDGLMVVIPFTELKPGNWEFSCTSNDPMVELFEEPWNYSIRLNVLPQEADAIEDWDAIWDMALEDGEALELPTMEAPREVVTEAPQFVASPEPTIEFSPAPVEKVPVKAESSVTSVQDMLRSLELESDEMADEILTEYGLTEIEEPAPIPMPLPIESVELPPLSIALVQDNYVVQRGQTLTLSGQIVPTSETDMPLILTQSELSICLRDPQSAEILLETREAIENQLLPSELTYRLTLPAVLKTRLIIGEMTLRDVMTEGKPVLASQAFTLTADTQELLDAVNAMRHIEDTEGEPAIANSVIASAPTPSKPASPLNLTFLNFVQSPKSPTSDAFVPAAKQPLPPKLDLSSLKSPRKLDLPNFSEDAPSLEPTQLEIPLPELTDPEPDVEQLEIALDASEPIAEGADPLEAETDDRFVDRLASLADNPELTEELKALADDRDSVLPAEEMAGLLMPIPELQPSPDSVENEFVVDDEPILPLADLVIARRQSSSEIEQATNPLMLAESEPVPTPALEISPDRLTAGATIKVIAKLPDVLPKIYVKVWINDRQSRAVLQAPRWLTEFYPNGLGNLEDSTEFTVPMGTVEIQVEAIAVEMMTNRESRKVSVDRWITPGEQPDFSVEDFEV